jgi:predicted MFS family arabinose efflux permease
VSLAAHRQRYALGGYFALNGLGLSCWAPRIPEVRNELAMEEAELGAVLLCIALGALLAMPATGALVDRYGARTTTVAAAAAYSMAIAGIGVAENGLMLGLVLFLTGLSNGALDVSMNTLAQRHERAVAQPMLAWFHGLFSLGTVAGAALGTSAAALGIPPGHQFFAVGCGGLFVALALGPAAPRHGPRCPSPAQPEPGLRDDRPAWRPLLPLGLMAFCVLLTEGAVADWTAVLLTDAAGASPGAAASGYLAFTIAMTAGRLAGDRVMVRLGPFAVLRWGAALMVPGLLALIAVPAVPSAVVGCVLLGIGLSCLFPQLVRHAALTADQAPGRAVSAVSTLGYFGFLVGPPLIGLVAEVVSLRAALAMLLLAPAAVLLLARNARPSPGVAASVYGAPEASVHRHRGLPPSLRAGP